MEWIYNSLTEAANTTGIARTTLMRWIRAGRVTATRRGRGPQGGRRTWCIAHSDLAAAAAALGWWEPLQDPWEMQSIREEQARQQAKIDEFRRRGYT